MDRLAGTSHKHLPRRIVSWLARPAGSSSPGLGCFAASHQFNCVGALADVHYPEADRITLVMDNLNAHRLSTLYEAFEPSQARRLIDRIEVVHTPNHGSWLNMAECELSVLEKQALGDRVGDESQLAERVTLWNEDRLAVSYVRRPNQTSATVPAGFN